MREIKFRAWDRKHKYMTAEVNLKDIFGGFACYQSETTIIMQYTGLHDKSGKEIYEGDIVKQIWDDGSENIGFVVYKEKEGMFLINYPKGGGSLMSHSRLDSEVIGNIYENPGLLGNND